VLLTLPSPGIGELDDDFVDDNVRRAHHQQWLGLQFREIIRPPNADSQLAFVRAEIAFISDWIESGDERGGNATSIRSSIVGRRRWQSDRGGMFRAIRRTTGTKAR
jgi:hypothetical protein